MTLACWPRALPIVVDYGGSPELDPPTLEDEDDIMVALKRPDRVNSISLTISSSLLERLSAAFNRPFPNLENLILLSRGCVRLTMPSAFRWGRHLRRLHSTGITIPALIRCSSRNLVDLQLHEVLNPWDFSRNVLSDDLPWMAQLQSLSLHLHPTTIDIVSVSPPFLNRAVLPALTRLQYRGITEDLENLVARIDAPSLEDIEVRFPRKSITKFSEFTAFIGRIEIHKSYRQAHVLSSEHAISISLITPGVPTRLKFQLFCKPLSEQLSYMAQIFTGLSALLFHVEDLRINVTRQSKQEDASYTRRWLKLLNLFEGVPALHGLYIPQPGPRHVPLRQALVSFMTLRRLSRHPIAIEYEQPTHMSELTGAGTKHAQCRHHCSLTCFQ